jgi:hypothetical protein
VPRQLARRSCFDWPGSLIHPGQPSCVTDADASKAIVGKQMPVAADDVVSCTCQSAFEIHVIGRVLDNIKRSTCPYSKSSRVETFETTPKRSRWPDLRQNRTVFSLDLVRDHGLHAAGDAVIEKAPRRPLRGEASSHECIGIDHNAHAIIPVRKPQVYTKERRQGSTGIAFPAMGPVMEGPPPEWKKQCPFLRSLSPLAPLLRSPE